MNTSGKIFLHHWKEHLKVYNSTLVKFESDSYVLSEQRYSSTELRKFTVWLIVWFIYCMVVGSNLPPTIQTSVNFHNFKELYLRLFSTNNFQTWRFFWYLKALGHLIFPNLSTWKVEQNHEGVYQGGRNQRLEKCGYEKLNLYFFLGDFWGNSSIYQPTRA